MAYEKHNWQTGEVITEELLDHMEEGIAEGVAGNITLLNIVDVEVGSVFESQINATWQEIFNAFSNGPVFLKLVTGDDNISMSSVTNVLHGEDGYIVTFIVAGAESPIVEQAIAETIDSNPVLIGD